ncbi:MAG: hypothetical protein WCJ72_10745 [Chryseobacterium sp.]
MKIIKLSNSSIVLTDESGKFIANIPGGQYVHLNPRLDRYLYISDNSDTQDEISRISIDVSEVTEVFGNPFTGSRTDLARMLVENFSSGSGNNQSVAVSNFPVSQVVSVNTLPLPTGASTAALQTAGNTSLNNIDSKIPSLIGNRAGVEVLGTPITARQLAVTTSTINVTLTAGIKRVSILARNTDMRFSIGNSIQNATSTSHYIAGGERLDFYIGNFATPNIACIALAGSGTLEITELS